MGRHRLSQNSNHRAQALAPNSRWLGSLAALMFLLAASVAVGAAVSTGGVAALGVGVIEGTWTTGAPMPVARSSSASASLNGVLYVAGGHDGSSMTSEVYAYDPAANAWTVRMAMPGPRYGGNGSAAINGKLYVAGGWTTYPYAPLPNSNLWEYDPAANTWSIRASMPLLSACGASAAINGKLYVSTACDGYSGYRNYLHVWDPANDTWTQLASSASAHAWSPAVGVVNGKLYLGGGVDNSDATIGLLEVYDPASNTWTTLAPMPTPRAGISSAVVNGKLYVAGGNLAGGAVTSVVESYDPQSNTWSTVQEMPTARSQMASGAIGNVIYFAGGSNGTATVNVTESLQFAATGDTTTTTSSATTTTTSAATTTTTTLAGAGTAALNFTPGWNLVGNSSSGTLDVATAFGDTAKVTTVWKWVASGSKWAFYAPSLVGQALTDYATSKGYDVLSTIAGGEGFWVNSKGSFTAELPAGSAIASASFQGIGAGWNLIAVGDSPTPSGFNKQLSLTPPAAGEIPLNVITLWAWDASRSNWYFYAPSLEKNGTLASYIVSKSYLDFESRTLGPETGFWVNVPADASGTTTSTTASTTTSSTTTSSTSATTTTTTSTSTASSTTTTASVTTTTIVTAPPCVYAINPVGANFGAEGGTNWFAVTATASPCLIQEWTSASDSAWISNGSKYGMSNGNGYISYSVQANNTAIARAGNITVTWNGGAANHAVTQSGANPFQGTVYGTWGGTCTFELIGPVSVSGTFAMTIDVNGGVSGTYSGEESGMITGSVNAGSGGLAATTSGAGNGGISWGGTFTTNPLRGNGSWTDSGFCSGTWATN